MGNPLLSIYDNLDQHLVEMGLESWCIVLNEQIATALDPGQHGDLPGWIGTYRQLPAITPSSLDLAADTIRIGTAANLDFETRQSLIGLLKHYHPWRKGPFSLFGIFIDTEWRSDWKWNRLKDHITPLAGRNVLDIGCGNGYFGWRMLAAGANFVFGIDPYLLYVLQYQVLAKYIGPTDSYVIPLSLDQLPDKLGTFDTVFSMGVFYHRRSPMDHLYELRYAARSGGEVVLETLVIEGEMGEVLVPADRYARMRNVWFIPSCLTLEAWLKRCGYRDVRMMDVSPTTAEEQRSTEWMTYESLPDFLDPDDPIRTVEGYPAPKRAIFVAAVP